MSDESLNALIKKAERARAKSDLPAKKKVEKPNTGGGKPYSFKTWWAMKGEWEPSMKTLFLWITLYALCFVATVYLLVMKSNNPAMVIPFYVSLGVSVLCIIRILRYHISALFTYPLYPHWTNGLSFGVEGWEKLVSFEGFTDGHNFMGTCTVTLQIKESSDYNGQVIDAALYLFCLKANKTFQKYYDHPGLKPFSNEGASLTGSVNNAIAGKLYRFTNGDIQKINHKIKCIEKVVIQVSNTIVTATELPEHDSVG